MKPAELSLQEVSLEFPTSNRPLAVISGLTLDVAKDEFVSVVGLSGCGKSTLLHLVAGFLQPTTGHISYRGAAVTGVSSARVMVFQEDSVFPWMTVLENAAYGPRARGVAEPEADRIAGKYIDLVGLREFAEEYPKNLSGGMRKRVDLARAYAAEPGVLLMDEPFGALDAYTRERMQVDLLELWQAEQKTVLFVTHDLAEALLMSDRVIVLSRRPARVHTVITVPFSRPRNRGLRKTPEFLKQQSLLEEILHSFEVADACAHTS